MIREATEADYSAILELAGEFWKHTMFSEPFEPEHTLQYVKLAHAQNLLVVVDVGEVVGFIAAIKSPLIGSAQAQFATELAWYVDPSHRGGKNGIALIQSLEKLARDAGIKYLVMLYMESSMPDVVRQMYERMGYQKTESSYIKEL